MHFRTEGDDMVHENRRNSDFHGAGGKIKQKIIEKQKNT